MSQDNELDQIRMRKIQAMLEAAEKSKQDYKKQPIILNDDNFSAALQKYELLVVDFWAPWCGPCRMIGPVIEQLAQEYNGKVTFGKLNVDDNQVIPSSFGIISVPTIVIFHKGKVSETIVGAYPKAVIETVIKRYLYPAI